MKIKNAGWLGLVAVLSFPPVSSYAQVPEAPVPSGNVAAAANISPAAGEVVKMAESGVTDDVMIAYIQNSQSPFNLSADNVSYLKDVGLSPTVVTAMLTHDRATPSQGAPYVYNQQAYPPSGQGQPGSFAPPQPTIPAPQPIPEPVAPAPQPVDQGPPPTYVSDAPPEVSYFYNDLAPYGSWVNLEGYGWCWQPRTVVVNRQWRPYCDGGHWVNSDDGWFWQSDYSWGWAPFHYGRWHFHERNGWVWFPDTTWGPAWVAWRGYGDRCGWAPLPLHATFDARVGFRFNGVSVGVNADFGLAASLFTFVALGDFNRHDIYHCRLPQAEVTRIYHNTTIINNYVINNNRVINRGIPVERVSASTHTQIPRVAIHDLPPGARGASRGASGSTPAVYRHELQAPVRSAPIVAQRVDEHHPVVQHAPVAPTIADRRGVPVNNASRGNTYSSGRPQNETTRIQPQQLQQPQQPAQRFIPQPQNQLQPPANHQPVISNPGSQRMVDNREAGKPLTTPTFGDPPPLKQPPKLTQPPYIPIQNVPSRPSVSSQAPSQEFNTHDFHPKSYHQAAEVHALPPDNTPKAVYSRPAPTPSQNQPQSSGRAASTFSNKGNSGGNSSNGNNGNNGNNNGNGNGNNKR